MNKKHLKFQTLAAIAGMCFLADAGAVPITDWGYRIESGFTAFTDDGEPGGTGVVGSNTNTEWSAPSTLTWTDTSGDSSGIDIGGSSNGSATGTVETNGAAVNTVTFTHFNNPLNGDTKSLATATLNDRIYLDPMLPSPPYDSSDDDEFSPPALSFLINFTETTNALPCAAPSPVGNPCNDIFVIDIVGAGFNPANKSINQNFDYPDPASGEVYGYNARIFIAGIDFLSDSACTAAGAGINCIGLTTIEGQDNTFQIALDITTEQFNVPVPGTLALFGLGLAGIGYRRKQLKKA